MTLLAQQGMSAVWRRSIVEALDVIVRRSTNPVTARAPARGPRPAPGPCAGPSSKPPNTPGDRPTNPWHQLYTDVAKRAGKNPAKAAVARKILIAAWHILSRQQAFKPAAPRRSDPASASSRCFLAA
jgi:hypothetical protein